MLYIYQHILIKPLFSKCYSFSVAKMLIFQSWSRFVKVIPIKVFCRIPSSNIANILTVIPNILHRKPCNFNKNSICLSYFYFVILISNTFKLINISQGITRFFYYNFNFYWKNLKFDVCNGINLFTCFLIRLFLYFFVENAQKLRFST